MATLISADDIKTELPGYDPEHAGEFHEASAKLADKRFEEFLKTTPYKPVILMSGGPASGKTEFVSEYLMDKDFLIFDGILPTEHGASIKIDRIKKAGKIPMIYAVWPQDLRQAYVAFLHRDRKYSDEHFYTKHASARKTLLSIAQNYPDVKIKIYKNAYLEYDLSFTEIQFDTRNDLIAFLEDNQYSKEEIIKLVTQ